MLPTPVKTPRSTPPRKAAPTARCPRDCFSLHAQTESELVALNVVTGEVDGRFLYPGFLGRTVTSAPDPYLLEQAVDVVTRLDRAEPWVPRSTWNVHLADTPDGGAAEPDAVVVGTGAKAYVLRYNGNLIAVLDPSQTADGGPPLATIDLSPLVQPGGDGVVEMTAGVFVPPAGLIYVVLGNINRKNVAADGLTLLCSNTVSTVAAIDVATDRLVPLAGGRADGTLALSGTNPIFGGASYDAVLDRLLIAEAGCNTPLPVDGGSAAGPLVGRQIEELSLFTGETHQLLDLTGAGLPASFTFIDATRAIVQTATTNAWDPTVNALGPVIPNAPDAFVFDGQDSLLGVSATTGADGGPDLEVVAVRIADGEKTVLAPNPFSLPLGMSVVGGVDLWPQL